MLYIENMLPYAVLLILENRKDKKWIIGKQKISRKFFLKDSANCFISCFLFHFLLFFGMWLLSLNNNNNSLPPPTPQKKKKLFFHEDIRNPLSIAFLDVVLRLPVWVCYKHETFYFLSTFTKICVEFYPLIKFEEYW